MLTVFFVAKVDSKLRSDTTKNHSATLDASGIEKHIGNMWNKRVVSKSDHLRFDFLILQK
jgi:alanyl-tRNA synthetase